MPNRTLPSPNIRKSLLEALKNVPVETIHLRESGIGKIVNFFAQRPGELEEIRRLANDLVTSWSRPILQHHAAKTEQRQGGGSNRALQLKSESLKSNSRRVSLGVESRQQKKIVQTLAQKKRTKRS